MTAKQIQGERKINFTRSKRWGTDTARDQNITCAPNACAIAATRSFYGSSPPYRVLGRKKWSPWGRGRGIRQRSPICRELRAGTFAETPSLCCSIAEVIPGSEYHLDNFTLAGSRRLSDIIREWPSDRERTANLRSMLGVKRGTTKVRSCLLLRGWPFISVKGHLNC